jgi:hypothetical protein
MERRMRAQDMDDDRDVEAELRQEIAGSVAAVAAVP